MLKFSEENKNVIGAFCKAQAAMRSAVKDSTNTHFKSSYADLSECLDVVREAYQEHGLAVIQTQDMAETGDAITIETTTLHTSGEWMRTRVTVPTEKRTAQGYGSAITYARRYGLKLHTGLSEEDDDGNAAQSVGEPAINSDAPCSPKQAQFIRSLLDEKNATPQQWTAFCQRYGATSPEGMTKIAASEAIERLQNGRPEAT